MKRRTFIKNTLLASVGATLLYPHRSFAGVGNLPDLVYAKGENYCHLLQLSLNALGGLNQLNLEGKRVLIKPTIQVNAFPEEAKNTSPELLYKLIRYCYDAKAWEVYVLDHTIDNWRLCYMNSGIEKASKEAFGKIMPANNRQLYKKDKNGLLLHQLVYECDCIINVPKINFTSSVNFTGALTNLHGLTWTEKTDSSEIYNRKTIALYKKLKPELTVMELTTQRSVQNQKGINAIICGRDGFAVDVFACQMLGVNPETVGYLKLAASLGEGELTTNQLVIEKIYM